MAHTHKIPDSPVAVQMIPASIAAHPDELIRYFQRIGQGGTRLSDDELTYCIIKQRYPRTHDLMTDIMKSPAGRLAGEVDLVLAAFRSAKSVALSPSSEPREWERIGRPSPKTVGKLEKAEAVYSEFEKLIPERRGTEPGLKIALESLRSALTYNPSSHPSGLPAILIARFPHQLVDVLVMLAVKRGIRNPWSDADRDVLSAFVIYWLLFVNYGDKAAWRAFLHSERPGWVFSLEAIQRLVSEYESEGFAYDLARCDHLSLLRQQVVEGDYVLRYWNERFTAADVISGCKPGESLRVLSTDDERIKRALMWLQRAYIWNRFPNYDPTSERDDDLPIDLDHIVPRDFFGFHWGKKEERLEDDIGSDTFRWQREVVGNTLGNYRWINSSENRARGKGAFVAIDGDHDLVSNAAEWNELIREGEDRRWSRIDVSKFQRLVDLRTLDLYQKLLIDTGMSKILPPKDWN